MEKNVSASNEPIFDKSTRGSHYSSVRPDFKYSLIVLSSLLIAHLTKLGNRPPNTRWVPRTKIPDVAPLTTPEGFSILDGDAPPFDWPLDPFALCHCDYVD